MVKRPSYIHIYDIDRAITTTPGPMLKKKITGAVVKKQAVPGRLLPLALRLQALQTQGRQYVCSSSSSKASKVQ